MATIIGRPTVELHVTICISELEARAIDALVGYGDDAFIECFKKGLGAAYLRDNEDGLRSFFKSMRNSLPLLLQQATEARKVFHRTSEAEGGKTS